MRGALHRLALGLTAWLAASGLAAAQAPEVATAAGGEPPPEVLVMLRLPPEHLRPNADYGGAYGDTADRSARRRIAERLARAYGLKLVNEWPMPLVGVDCFVLEAPKGRSPSEVAERLSQEPSVAWSQPMNLYEAKGRQTGHNPRHNDPLYLAQPAARAWSLAELHRVATGRNVRVAVVDSQVEKTHPDLIGQVVVSRDFAPGRAVAAEQHGTAVAGLIAARADNGIGIAGVAPGARLMALRACWQEASRPAATVCDSLALARALDFAITHDARIINLSLAGPPDRLLSKLLDTAQTRRIIVVAAYDKALPAGGFPASHPGVVAVAEDTWGALPAGVYSAPGRDVPTTTPGGHWSLVSGSSFSAAQVSGLFALLRERSPASGAAPGLVAASVHGGAVEACASLLRAARSCDCDCHETRQAAALGIR